MLSETDFACIKSMNIHTMLAFVAVMQTGSLLGASIILGTSTSNVSVLLKKFNAFFSRKLFDRDGRYLRPTEHAFVLYENIEGICKNIIGVMRENNDSVLA